MFRCWHPYICTPFSLPWTPPQVQPRREVLAGEHRLQPRSVPLRHQGIRSHAQGAFGGWVITKLEIWLHHEIKTGLHRCYCTWIVGLSSTWYHRIETAAPRHCRPTPNRAFTWFMTSSLVNTGRYCFVPGRRKSSSPAAACVLLYA